VSIAAMRRGEIDVAIGYIRPEDDGLEHYPIQQERYVVAMPPRHRLSGRAIEMADLADEPLVCYPASIGGRVYNDIMGAFQDRGITPNVVQEAEGEETLLEFVAVGFGCAIVTASVLVRRELHQIEIQPILDMHMTETLAMFWNPAPSIQTQELLDIMRPLITAHRQSLAEKATSSILY
jgi:DNA-binding transcriptional LysR family regulator